MDFSDWTKMVYDRIQQLEPELVSKIVGYILVQLCDEKGMCRLAFGPEIEILNLIYKAKQDLGLNKALLEGQCSSSHAMPISIPEYSPHYSLYSSLSSSSSPTSLGLSNSIWDMQMSNLDYHHSGYAEHIGEDMLENHFQFLNLDDHFGSSLAHEFSGNYRNSGAIIGPRTRGRSSNFPLRVCHYFIKGYCKHGNNCRYLHPQTDTLFRNFQHCLSELASEDREVCQSSLDKLELELTELLKTRRGVPVSIASLPTMYHEKYGKTLQAVGYLTESQRHGKSGYSLTKLLTRLSGNICLFERPHGQHFVLLEEDVQKFMEHANEKHGGELDSSANQIYLTFPAESTFSEQDVSNYFSQYGPVQDVRIPSLEQKRMFGFVTFAFAETAKKILSSGNPHIVCDSRVLVKPYRERCKNDRKHAEKSQPLKVPNPSFSRHRHVRTRKYFHHLFSMPAQSANATMEDFDYLIDFLNSDSEDDNNGSSHEFGK